MSDQTALTLPDPEGMNHLVTELADDASGWLEQLHSMVGDNDSAREMVVIVHENVQALAGHALHLTAVAVGLMEVYETTREQLRQALHERDSAIDEADEAYANARDELREDRQLRTEIECEVARDLIVEASDETWREGYDCGHLHASQDKDAEIVYLSAELDRYKYLLELAGVEIKETS
jgi:uncharacterized protein YPO0396